MTELRTTFDTEGFVVFPDVLSDHESICLRLQDLIDEANIGDGNDDWDCTGFVQSPASKQLQKIQGIGLVAPWVLTNVFRQTKLLESLAKIRPDATDLFGTKFFPMYPGETSVSWHQDSHYFYGIGSSKDVVSCAIYLEDADERNGALRLIPRSHKKGLYPHSPGVGEWQNGQWISLSNDEEETSVTVPAKAGSVVMFNPMLVHAAHKNTSADNRSRFSLFWHYLPSGLDFKGRGIDFSRGVYADRYGIDENE